MKELLGSDVNASPDSVSIESKNRGKLKIRIKTQDRQSIKEVALKRNLKVEEQEESILISQP